MTHEAQDLNFSRYVTSSLEQVKAYFNFLHIPDAEAEVFYFYYQEWTGAMNRVSPYETGWWSLRIGVGIWKTGFFYTKNLFLPIGLNALLLLVLSIAYWQ